MGKGMGRGTRKVDKGKKDGEEDDMAKKNKLRGKGERVQGETG